MNMWDEMMDDEDELERTQVDTSSPSYIEAHDYAMQEAFGALDVAQEYARWYVVHQSEEPHFTAHTTAWAHWWELDCPEV